jgi:hypothetical protein
MTGYGAACGYCPHLPELATQFITFVIMPQIQVSDPAGGAKLDTQPGPSEQTLLAFYCSHRRFHGGRFDVLGTSPKKPLKCKTKPARPLEPSGFRKIQYSLPARPSFFITGTGERHT